MFAPKRPYSAVSVMIDQMTNASVPENDLGGLPELVDVVNIQDTGPAEAARALRKKLKYGSVHRQLRALTILDALIENAGPQFKRSFADEPLLERLRFCASAPTSDPEVRKKCDELFRGWASMYKNTRGMERVAKLYKELPKRKLVVTQEKSKVIQETDNPFEDDEETVASSSRRTPSISAAPATQPAPSKDKDKKKGKKPRKIKKFDFEAEKDNMKAHIADAAMTSVNLTNLLQSINREQERISENPTAVKLFEQCKLLRKNIIRYIYNVESEEWLGSLLHANDALITALMTYEQLDRSIDADSDSDDEMAEQAHLFRMATEKAKGKEPASPTSPVPGMAGLSIRPSPPPRPAPPPRPSAASKPSNMSRPIQKEPSDDEEEEEEDNNPFADRNEVTTPKVEREEHRW
ncbi:hypothetical protein B0T18DRAFT_414762 [Schizothecium vesticola]|uniref:VHS domain-containing protein n=1 Tax=Schizothecium vesticola TaxID=314040 RepID=A0AA40EPS8_9PEZI|nr:hypothetical protein B0T18DRAFT_414762 [Schizothecium vesticola]